MTIEELKQAQAEAEQKIFCALNDLISETGLTPVSVNFDVFELRQFGGLQKTSTGPVTVVLELR